LGFFPGRRILAPLMAMSRYGARVIPNTDQTLSALEAAGQLVQGPHIEEFERAFAARLGMLRATSASYGRMAFFYLLEALDLPPGSEVVVPALTFWVVPEMVRVAGLRLVFADVDPETFTLQPESFARAITGRTRVVVPTHLWGLPCDMDPILEIARARGITVIEDCAHALDATYKGRAVGTIGDAGFFSFQTLKPLNTYGGGMAVARDPEMARRVAALAAAEPWPSEKQVRRKMLIGRVQRIAIRPRVFTWSLFPVLWSASWIGAQPDVYLWEKIRPLHPLPPSYSERYSNAQAAIGLEALRHLDAWTATTRAHAQRVDAALAGLEGVGIPRVPPDRTHVYYQYCLYVPDRAGLVRDCIRRGVDVESLHVDLCTSLALFGERLPAVPGAERAAQAVQLPIYASLTDADVDRVTRVVRRVLERSARARRMQP
jgi:perosamine synthetase